MIGPDQEATGSGHGSTTGTPTTDATARPPDSPSPSSRRRSGWGVTARLLGLVMLPVTVMCLLTGTTVLAHRASATGADAVARGVVGLSDLVALRASLNDQEAAAEFDVRFAEVGVTRAEASAFLGFDWTTEIPLARTESIRAASSLGTTSPVDALALQTLYSAMDAGTVSATEAAQKLGRFGEATGVAMNGGLDRLEGDARQLPLLAALESLRIASNLLDVTTPQVIDLSAIWFPAPGATAEAITALVARFGAESADYANGHRPSPGAWACRASSPASTASTPTPPSRVRSSRRQQPRRRATHCSGRAARHGEGGGRLPRPPRPQRGSSTASC